LVLLPFGALTGLGLRVISNEQQAFEYQQQSLTNARLQAVDAAILAYFARLEQQLLDDAHSLNSDTESLRSYLRQEPRLRQVFIMNPQGERLHPPADEPVTEAEQAFLERTGDIWRDQDILYQSGLDPREGNANAPLMRRQALRQPASSDTDRYGWYVWHWGAETDLIFWQRDALGNLIGFELEPLRLSADLIALLPATNDADNALQGARIRLINARNEIVYQWGDFEPPSGHAAAALLPLSHPLGSWKLNYYTTTPAFQGGLMQLVIIAALLATGAALTGLAFYLYREHTRELRLARQRVNFVNQVSHELKTPLTNIRMYAEMLDDYLVEDDTQARRYLDIIVSESQRLSRLITNVLSFARQQRGQSHLRLRPGQVDEVIAAVLATFRPALAERGMNVEWDAQADQLVNLDPDALEQILTNLLSNAEKYAAGGALHISSQQTDNQTTLQIRDWGPGIAKREQQRIFQPFYRSDSRLNEGTSGTGIGLTIARELARLHGGDLVLQPIEQGSCFKVTLRTEPVEEMT
jgi:signal transduction histidine kinase